MSRRRDKAALPERLKYAIAAVMLLAACEVVGADPCVFTGDVPDPRAIAISPGGDFGSHMYVVSGHGSSSEIWRVDPQGNAEFYADGPEGDANVSALCFDTTPERRYGGDLFLVVDWLGGGTCVDGVFRLDTNGVVIPFVDGCSNTPRLFGTFSCEFDDQGAFGYSLIVDDFEADDHGGSTCNILHVTPSAATSCRSEVLGSVGLSLDRSGAYGGLLLVANLRQDPFWQGDNDIVAVDPSGATSIAIPETAFGGPRDVLVVAPELEGWEASLVAIYLGESSYVVEFSGMEPIRSHEVTGLREQSLAQDRSGAFGHGIFFSAAGGVWRLDCAAVSVESSDSLDGTLSSYPNPFSTSVTVDLGPLRADSRQFELSAEVLDVSGRVVDLLVPSETNGRERLVWDGTIRDGRPAPNGVYLVRVSSGSEVGQVRVCLYR